MYSLQLETCCLTRQIASGSLKRRNVMKSLSGITVYSTWWWWCAQTG